jgi:hypothetical protein
MYAGSHQPDHPVISSSINSQLKTPENSDHTDLLQEEEIINVLVTHKRLENLPLGKKINRKELLKIILPIWLAL